MEIRIEKKKKKTGFFVWEQDNDASSLKMKMCLLKVKMCGIASTAFIEDY